MYSATATTRQATRGPPRRTAHNGGLHPISDVADHFLAWLSRAEVAADEIRDRPGRGLDRQRAAAAHLAGHQAQLAHQRADELLAAAYAPAAQLGVHPPVAVSPVGVVECLLDDQLDGQRTLSRRDHASALAAALWVRPAEIAPSVIPGFGEWEPAPPVPASAFPLISDDIAVARHRELAGQLTGYVSCGDTYAARTWLRRMARDPGVSPRLPLDQLTAPDTCLSGLRSRPLGGSEARLVSAGRAGRGRAG